MQWFTGKVDSSEDPKQYVTFGERRNQVDLKLIKKDMEAIESAFLTGSQRLNEKRLQLLEKKLPKIISQMSSNKEATLKGFTLPSQKEYKKLITKLITTSFIQGDIRATSEMKYLKTKFSNFAEVFPEVLGEADNYTGLSDQTQAYIDNYAMQITRITEATVVNAIVAALNQAYNQGLSPEQIAPLVMEAAGVWMSPSHATTIARTEMSKMYNAARLARYRSPENKGFVVALQYDAILDGRTTKVCRHLDGRIISIDRQDLINEYSPPNHFQCRSVWLPVTKFEVWEDNWSTSEEPQKGFTTPPADLSLSAIS